MYLRASFVRVVAKAAPTKKSPSIMYCLMGGLKWLTQFLNIHVQSTGICTSYTQPHSKLALISWLNTWKNFAFTVNLLFLNCKGDTWYMFCDFIFQNSGILKSKQFCFSTSLNICIHWTSPKPKYEKISAQQIMLKLFLFMSLLDKIKSKTLPLFLLCRRWGRTKCALCGVGSVSCHQLLYLSTGLHLCNS